MTRGSVNYAASPPLDGSACRKHAPCGPVAGGLGGANGTVLNPSPKTLSHASLPNVGVPDFVEAGVTKVAAGHRGDLLRVDFRP